MQNVEGFHFSSSLADVEHHPAKGTHMCVWVVVLRGAPFGVGFKGNPKQRHEALRGESMRVLQMNQGIPIKENQRDGSSYIAKQSRWVPQKSRALDREP